MHSTLLALLVLLPVVLCDTFHPHILFTYQSQGIPFAVWFGYLTICLAPLIAHIAGGVEPITSLTADGRNALHKPPNWAARITHFNPISIVWRYYAIADRRLRARAWDERDMAAANAVFWDGQRGRFDGSEEKMVRSRAWISKLPEAKHVLLFSGSTVTTAILTVQGIETCYLIFSDLGNTTSSYGQHFGQGLPSVFAPLGCLGLLRVPAALWLSRDYGYVTEMETSSGPDIALEPLEGKDAVAVATPLRGAGVSEGLLGAPIWVGDRLVPRHGRRGFIYRIWWFASISALLGGSTAACSRMWWGLTWSSAYVSLSHVIFNCMYIVTTSGGLLITVAYILFGRTDTTIIPCIHAAWYKLYTVLLFVMYTVCIVVSALETRNRADGSVTSLPEFFCNQTTKSCVPVARGQGNNNFRL